MPVSPQTAQTQKSHQTSVTPSPNLIKRKGTSVMTAICRDRILK
ncbi:hypothetical protein NBRC3257_3306 [Gluconobacter thailandicus NBRC 3257]|uniref:Uncharacterized protein n=1 Tax=Gluconobacter thailandicus NBRC 3257 TaxID=1381097 RepID=A0ABQ0J1I9_GLUTH|nr:hypothetical protein NBRC3257_3306 [Gluconobacter thailandicus NBRC 3257]